MINRPRETLKVKLTKGAGCAGKVGPCWGCSEDKASRGQVRGQPDRPVAQVTLTATGFVLFP